MDVTLAAAAALIGAPNAQFLALLFIGSSIGWCATKLARVDIRTGALLLAGVTGAWLAAELAVRAGLGQRGADAVLIAAAFGAMLFCLAWRARRYVDGSAGHIAVRH